MCKCRAGRAYQPFQCAARGPARKEGWYKRRLTIRMTVPMRKCRGLVRDFCQTERTVAYHA